MARTKNRFNALGNYIEPAEEQSIGYHTALYARISVENADKPTESIENQLELMKRFIKEKPELSLYREYTDRAYTGTNLNRPAFQAMMEDARAGRINCIIVKDLSRLGCDYLETCNLIETIFPFLGVRFISVNDYFDSNEESCGNKDLEISVKNMVNDMYARDTSKRVSDVRRQEIERGRFVGSTAPYGYRIDYDHPLRKLIIDPQPAEVVKDMFRMALSGMSLRDISVELQKRNLTIPGVYAKTGQLYQDVGSEQNYWRIGTISQMLKNEVYIGNMVQGKRRQRLWDGEGQQNVSAEEWVIVEDTHEPIISKEDFYRLRDLLAVKQEESTFGAGLRDELPMKPNKYVSMLFCGSCGHPMLYCSDTRYNRRSYYFICSNDYQLDKGRCKTRITEAELDKAVTASITAVYKAVCKGQKVSNIKLIYEETLAKEEQKYKQRRKKMNNQIATVHASQAEAYEQYGTGRITRSDFAMKVKESDKVCKEIEEEIHVLDKKFRELKRAVKQKKRWITFLSDGSKEGSLSADLLQLLVDRIEVEEGRKIHIIYAFAKPGGDA